MKHFNERIEGWFNYPDLYREMVQEAGENSVFVEIGAWKGASSAFMAVEIINSGKKIDFFVVDHFQGSREHQDHQCVIDGTLKEEFLTNMFPVLGNYSLYEMHSTKAAMYFHERSVDFCFIDASHEYEDVKADIEAWLPKIKPGHLLAGDDFECYPGVAKAVEELLPGFSRTGNLWRYRCPFT